MTNRFDLRCSGCDNVERFDLAAMLARLQLLGKLRRAVDPEEELVVELFLASTGLMRCGECGHAGLTTQEAADDDDWEDVRSCAGCGQPIPTERLEVFPDARRCAACESRGVAGGEDEREFCPACGGLMVLRQSAAGGNDSLRHVMQRLRKKMITTTARLVPICLALLSVVGCTQRGDWYENANPSRDFQTENETRTPAPERSLGEQILAVKSGASDAIYIEQVEISDQDLARLGGLAGLRVLNIDRGRITDGGVEHLAVLPNLEQLKLGRSAISDAGLVHLERIKTLRVLNLPHADFSDDGIARLRELPKLELLRFGSPRVTDDGLTALRTFPAIRFLHLIDVPITDEGLRHVAEISTLESFYLDGSRVTDDGISKLLTARRDLHFHQDQRHHDLDPRKDDHRH